MAALGAIKKQTGLYGEPAVPKLNSGMASGAPMGQKTIQPVSQPAQTQAPGMNWDALSAQKFAGEVIGNPQGFNNQGLSNSYKNLAKTIGYAGSPTMPGTYDQQGWNEGGEYTYQAQGEIATPEFLQALKNYNFTTQDTGDGRATIGIQNPDGTAVGSYLHGDKNSSFDNFAEKAVPLGLAAIGAGAAGLFGPVGAGAEVAAGNGAFLGEGVASGVPAWDAAAGLGAAETGAAAGLTLEAAPLPGAEGFGFQNVGAAAGEGALPYTTAAADSQLASTQLGITGAEAAATGAAPAGVNLGTLGTYATGGGIANNIANALEAAKVNPTRALASAGGSLVDFAKANPGLASLGVGAIGQLAGGSPSLPSLPGSGGSSAGGSGGSSTLATALENQIGSMGAPDYSGVFGLKNTAGDLETLNQEAIDAAYSQQTRMLDPQFQRDQQAMEARLAEQGFVPGTPGYARAMQIFNESRNQAYGSARDSSILQGYQIGQGDARNQIANTELNNSASRESLAQLLAKRNQPFNELASIKGNQQIDYNNALDRYNAEAASSNSRNQALSQLALALGMYLG